MPRPETKLIKLSPSALNLFLDCPRCFWLDKVKDIKRPRGIFPSLPSGMDRIIKVYFDSFRAKHDLPPDFLKRSEFDSAKLFEDQTRLEKWRSWRTGLIYKDEDGSVLSGALDDLLVKDGKYIPFDYKTKGSPTTETDAVKYYQTQIDMYALMLEANQMPTAGYGFLLYYSPKTIANDGCSVTFELQPIRISTDTERAKKVFRSAVSLLRSSMPVSGGASCEYCGWLGKFRTGLNGR